MIRKGMYVRGTPKSDDIYYVTNSKCICKVINVYNIADSRMVVEVVDSPIAQAIGNVYTVDTYYFRPISATVG